jgi:hypothetical protein
MIDTIDTRRYVVEAALDPDVCEAIIEANRPHVAGTVPRSGGYVHAHP